MAMRTEHSVLVDSLAVRYDSYGETGAALVFIHGWTCDRSLWDQRQLQFPNYRSIFVDLPGHGKSDIPAELPLDLYARSIGAVLEQAGADKAILVGHSMGGPIATMVARLFPERTKGIIYIDSFWQLPESYMTREGRKGLKEQLLDDNFVRTKLEDFWTPHTTPKMRERIMAVMLSTNKHVRVNTTATDNCLPHMLRADFIFPFPALHLVSPIYRNIDPSWLLHMPQLETVDWSEYGHFLFMEDVPRFRSEVERFLLQHPLE